MRVSSSFRCVAPIQQAVQPAAVLAGVVCRPDLAGRPHAGRIQAGMDRHLVSPEPVWSRLRARGAAAAQHCLLLSQVRPAGREVHVTCSQAHHMGPRMGPCMATLCSPCSARTLSHADTPGAVPCWRYACSIPVLVLQTVFNDKMDRRLGLPTAALIRFTIGLGGLAVLMSYFPMLATSHRSLLLVTGWATGKRGASWDRRGGVNCFGIRGCVKVIAEEFWRPFQCGGGRWWSRGRCCKPPFPATRTAARSHLCRTSLQH